MAWLKREPQYVISLNDAEQEWTVGSNKITYLRRDAFSAIGLWPDKAGAVEESSAKR